MESALAVIPTSADVDPQDDILSALIRKVQESEDATRTAREKAERDRDYLDGKQLTQDEHDALVKRGQPPIAFNVIRSRVDFHQGLEKKQRRDPKAWPRNNPNDAQAADAFTDAMRYVIEEADYSSVRSAVWRNVTVEGFGGLEMWVQPGRDGNHDIRIGHIPWDRLLTDPHSSKPDYSDSSYIGQVLWMDLEDALARYGEGARTIVETTLSPTSVGETFDDKPKATLWADRARQRIRVVVMWCRKAEGWHFYEFTRGGILDQGRSPYLDDDGEAFCPLILESCFVDRENNRYGVVRDLIDPQDELNKRRSKSLHLLTMQGVIADEDAVENVAEAKRQLARPDFWIAKRPNAQLEVVRNTDLARGQQQMGAEAMAYIMQSGPNAALLGKGVEEQSGRAIEAQQAGGLIEHGDLMDTLRRLDRRVFRMVAMLIKQFWTAEKWIRVTDDELAPRWVGLNVPEPAIDPMTGQPIVNPWTGEPMIAGVQNNVAELDMDIIVMDAPDVVTLDSENFQSVTQLLAAQPNMNPQQWRLLVEMHPGLTSRRKKQLLDMVEQPQDPQAQAMAQQQMQMQQAAFAADMEEKAATTEEKRASAFKSAAQGQEIASRNALMQQSAIGFGM